MKKIRFLFIMLLLLSVTFTNNVYAFNVDACKNYAVQYALDASSFYPEFPADCTNFVSQCMQVAGIKEDFLSKKEIDNIGYNDLYEVYKDKDSWFCEKYTRKSVFGKTKTDWVWSSTWSVVAKNETDNWWGFYNYFKTEKKATVQEYDCSNRAQMDEFCKNATLGDVIQIRKTSKANKMHSMIVTKKTNNNGKYNIYLSYHSSHKVNQNFRDTVYNAFKEESGATLYTIIDTSSLKE